MKVICISEPPDHNNSFTVGNIYPVYTVPYVEHLDGSMMGQMFNYVPDRFANRYKIPSKYFTLLDEFRESKLSEVLN